jgi:hypothetical protein
MGLRGAMFLQERGELGRHNDPETAGPRLTVDLDQAAAAPSRAPAGVTRAIIRAGGGQARTCRLQPSGHAVPCCTDDAR